MARVHPENLSITQNVTMTSSYLPFSCPAPEAGIRFWRLVPRVLFLYLSSSLEIFMNRWLISCFFFLLQDARKCELSERKGFLNESLETLDVSHFRVELFFWSLFPILSFVPKNVTHFLYFSSSTEATFFFTNYSEILSVFKILRTIYEIFKTAIFVPRCLRIWESLQD
jgi:hypothetical protein